MILSASAVFVAAALLFVVEPLAARLVLPRLGGAPAVWSTALVFYQGLLLAGYAWAHALVRLDRRAQVLLHLSLLLAAATFLPLTVPPGAAPAPEHSPLPWLLGFLGRALGLPFLVLAATSPLLSRWVAEANGARRDPYVLYAVSNAGSLVGLLLYPSLLEPYLTLGNQGRLWTAGFLLYGLLTLMSAIRFWRLPLAPSRLAPIIGDPRSPGDAAQRGWWLGLALLPASLLVSVTAYLGTDIAAVPLLWVVPLALYLITWSLVFARRRLVPHRLVLVLLPVLALPLTLTLAAGASEPAGLVVPAHLLTFFVVALACHGELARLRPPPERLTEFYLWLGAGGVAGGLLAALVAPALLTSVAEYPLALVLALLAVATAPGAGGGPIRLTDLVAPGVLGLLAVLLMSGVATGTPPDRATAGMIVGGCALVSLVLVGRPVAFALSLAAILVAAASQPGEGRRTLHAERTFFGVHRVTVDPGGHYHLLLHGTTVHGAQSLDPARRSEPLAYFHGEGPVGQVFRAWRAAGGDAPAATEASAEGGSWGVVGVIGLGAGSLACHGVPGERWVFYEIDPAVIRIAGDRRLFTFVRDCPPEATLVPGDARLSLGRASPGSHHLLVLDAYGGDSPPVHLLTREALQTYLTTLSSHGILLFNITNRHLDLEPVLARLVADAGLEARINRDTPGRDLDRPFDRLPSTWVVAARSLRTLGGLVGDPRWQPLALRADLAIWTDDYAALFQVFRWQ